MEESLATLMSRVRIYKPQIKRTAGTSELDPPNSIFKEMLGRRERRLVTRAGIEPAAL